MDPLFTEDAITRFALDDPQIARAVRNLNSVHESYKTLFANEVAEVTTCDVLAGNPRHLHLSSHIHALKWCLGVRARDHLEDFGHGLVAGRAFSAALAARASIETSAAIVYFEEKLTKLVSDRQLDAALDEVHRAHAGGRFDWLAADQHAQSLSRANRGKEWEVPEARRATNIMTMLLALDRRLCSKDTSPEGADGAVRTAYAMLSDLCHPATGTAILLTKPGKHSRKVELLRSVDDQALRWLFWNVGLLVAPIAHEAFASLLAFGALHPE